ncbi:mercuric reductase [Pontibacter qinzhouensis]|uniref:Mercuric reductase n=1 Tax=Pontibacter qinzhouensis TaxID=2603253 RepID=A0A5C8KDJ0_9BACT|nr:mercuric reductase [Pontibacter qinzhouensis]TXK50771.1 mercuric reductase [Pontibacter qinzhouensis]
MSQDKTTHYDAIVVGSGQGGTPLVKELASAGWKVALIEEHHVGGSCVNYGCTPTKTLLASAQVAHTVRHAADFGVQAQLSQVDLQAVKNRRDAVVKKFRDGSQSGLEESEADLIFSKASFLGPNKLLLTSADGDKREVTADKIILNTGTSTRIPAINGLDKVTYLTHKTIQELTELPAHLLIIGGGYIAVEFGQMFRRFGSRVTIVQRTGQLLTREDPDVAEALQHLLKSEGIELLLEAEPQQAQQLAEGNLLLKVKDASGQLQEVQASHILLATGVKANTEGLQLEKAGIRTDEKGNIKTDQHLCTSSEGVYAIGDVKGGPMFTHISYDDFRILRDMFLHQKKRSTADRPVPYCVFTDPQLGRIGLTEKQAKEQHLNYKAAKLEMATVARGIETGQTNGFYKVLVDAETDQILGAAILAPEGGEIMSALQIAMMGKLTYQQLQEGVFAHPTYIESFNNLFLKLSQPED